MKILFLVDKYYPKPLANSICAQELVKLCTDRGHEVHVLAYTDTGIQGVERRDGAKVFYVAPDFRMQMFYYGKNFPGKPLADLLYKAAGFLSKSKKMFLIKYEPFYSFTAPLRIRKRIENLYSRYHYDLIVSVYSPFDSALAMYWLKKKGLECKWCIYALDPFFNPRLPIKDKKSFWLEKFLRVADLFIYMQSRSDDFEYEELRKYKFKMKAADIPLLTVSSKVIVKPMNPNREVWVYAGSLGKPHYDESLVVKCFANLEAKENRVWHIYTSASEVKRLKHLEEKTNGRIKLHNYVSRDELALIYKEADVLVSIKSSDQISAKIFEYMNYGKRIVHFSCVKNDPNKAYIEKYAKGYVVDLYEKKSEQAANDLEHMIDMWREEKEIMEIEMNGFELNCPGYTVKLLEEFE